VSFERSDEGAFTPIKKQGATVDALLNSLRCVSIIPVDSVASEFLDSDPVEPAAGALPPA
jgi:hypothetical protein